jgi:hypothetical protein
MLKTILKEAGAKKLSAHAQKNIFGGTRVQPVTCSCFCYTSTGVKVNAYCYACCPNGAYPGINPGSTGNCGFTGSCGGLN